MYLTQHEVSVNAAMQHRVAQCAASEAIPDPDFWASMHAREWAAAPGWWEAWESALVSHPVPDLRIVDPDAVEPPAYDPGEDEAVITDAMILAEVQRIATDEAGA